MRIYRVWQVKRDGQVTGPFPENLIIQHILIGRIRPGDLISMDGHFWKSFEHTPEILDQIRHWVTDEGDPQWREERQRAILRNADERKRPDPRSHETAEEAAAWMALRVGSDRRKKPETVEQHAYRETIAEVDHWLSSYRSGKDMMAVLLLVLAMLTGLALHYFGAKDQPIDIGLHAASCDAQAASQVDWHGCDKTDYVLAGADLRSANLSGTRFSGANLSYANFKGARVDGAMFDGANLTGAIWVDGRVCAAGSVGICR
jgi:hypothetical protein